MSHPNMPDDEAPATADVTGAPAHPGDASTSEEPPNDAGPEDSQGQEPTELPFTERYRLGVGLVAAALALSVAVFFAVVGPASAIEPGAFGLIMRWGTPVLWGLLAVAAITWAVRMPKKVTNGLATVVLVAYLVYLIARSL